MKKKKSVACKNGIKWFAKEMVRSGLEVGMFERGDDGKKFLNEKKRKFKINKN